MGSESEEEQLKDRQVAGKTDGSGNSESEEEQPKKRQTARKSTGGRRWVPRVRGQALFRGGRLVQGVSAGRPHTGNKSLPKRLQPGEKEVKKRFRPGELALQDIRRYQRSTELLIKALPFQRLVREICNEYLIGAKF